MKPILFNTDEVRATLDGRKSTKRLVVKPKYSNTHFEMRSDKYGTRLIELQNEEPGVTTIKNPDGTTTHTLLAAREVHAPCRPGDILYVRETWFYESHMEDQTEGAPDLPSGRYSHRYVYKADAPDYPVSVGVGATGWHPSIHMPREAARIWLQVTDVRVERLQTSFFEPICPIFAVQAEGIDIGDTCRECIENYGEPCCVDTVDEDGSDLYGGECGELDQSRGEFSDLWDSTIKPADRERYGWAANPWVWVIAFERCDKPEGV